MTKKETLRKNLIQLLAPLLEVSHERWQKLTIDLLVIWFVLSVTFFIPPLVSLLGVLFIIALEPVYTGVLRTNIPQSLLGKLAEPYVIKFLQWADKNAIGKQGDELDFSGAPWLPDAMRLYYIQLAGLMQMQRFLQEQKDIQKKKTKRGKRGRSN